MSTASYIDDLEDVTKIVADWAYNIIQEVVKVLSPDGRPFGMKTRTPEEKILEYQNLRGNPQNWANWITSNADFITQQLRSAGVAEDKVLSIHPYDLAIRLAVNYSVEMEQLLNKQANKMAKGVTPNAVLS